MKLERNCLADALIDPAYERIWNEEEVANSGTFALFTAPQEAPKLIGEFRSCNVVSFGGRIWAVPRYLGHVELDDPQRPSDPRIRHAETIEAALAAVAQGEDEARRLLGEGASYDVLDCNGTWMAIPHAIGLTDGSKLVAMEGCGILTASSREELVLRVLKTRLREMGAAGTELMRVLDEWRLSPARMAQADAPPGDATASATEQFSTASISAKLAEISAVTQALASRLDRISAISEQALLAVADLHHRAAAGAPHNPPRQFGVLRWSLRQPRKAFRSLLGRLRAFLKEPVTQPRRRAESAALAPRDKPVAGI